MIKNVAIICEYNLFHNGHAYQINKIRQKYENSCIIALMSGNYVQRGDLAVLPKNIRAAAACEYGVDIVLELPYPYSGGTAEYFARGAVSILNGFTGVDELCFGSESDNLYYLHKVMDRLLSDEFSNKLKITQKKFISTNMSFNKIRQDLYEEMYREPFITKPNDILAVEYLKALKAYNSTILPFQITRKSDYSATKSRKYFHARDFNKLKNEVPDSIYKMYESTINPVKIHNIEKFVLAYFRTNNPKDFCQYADVTDGIEYLLYNSANRAVTFNKFFNMCRTKKYSDAKIRRVILNCMLKTTEEMLKSTPLYTNILAFNEVGRNFLANQRKSDVKIITKPADYKKHSNIISQYEHSITADKIYTLAMEPSQSSDYFIKLSPYIKNEE